jgi:hypothetical protein
MNFVNPFESSGNWYKANLHCHTTMSDGEVSVDERIEQYRRKKYDVLAITDHDIVTDVAKYSDKDFLSLAGMESHPPCPFGGDMYHLVCLNLPQGFKLAEHYDAETRILMVKHAGGEVIMGHPYWCGHNVNHLMAIEGYIGIEVYNAGSGKIGKAFSSVHWDGLLDAGRFVGGIAADDTHHGRDIFMGWTMIKAEQLSAGAVMDALRNGSYYASCGPVIKKFTVKGSKAVVECSDAVEIHFMSKRSHGFSVYSDDGAVINKAECDLSALAHYVRVEVVDKNGLRAWTNPIILKL